MCVQNASLLTHPGNKRQVQDSWACGLIVKGQMQVLDFARQEQSEGQ